jgi:formate hydrogenlyase subunit 3/multisubunit Na+/H+ antiporter MnhD subunit
VLVALALAMLLLLFAVGMAGTTLAGSMFLFYIFWELMLVASCALIAIWGEGERRGAVALKSCTAAVAP